MQRIIRVEKFFYEVIYSSDNDTPTLESVFAFTDLLLFEQGMPVIFESADDISLGNAEKMTVDRAGKFPLASMLIEALKTPKSNPVMLAVF